VIDFILNKVKLFFICLFLVRQTFFSFVCCIIKHLFFLYFPRVFGGGNAQPGVDQIQAVIESAVIAMIDRVAKEKNRIEKTQSSINYKAIARNDLEKEFKALKNKALLEIQEVLEDLGIYSLYTTVPKVMAQVNEDQAGISRVYYDHGVRDELFRITLTALQTIKDVVDTIWARFQGRSVVEPDFEGSFSFLHLLTGTRYRRSFLSMPQISRTIKGTVSRDFLPLRFFPQTILSGPMIHGLKSFRIYLSLRSFSTKSVAVPQRCQLYR
jgi:hypothetical protein